MARSAQVETHVRHVRDVLRDYAGRGVFRSLDDGERRAGRTTFTMVWHHGLPFRFVLDTSARTVSFPALLPGVPARSSMAQELKAFLDQFQTSDVPAHRRIDPARARLRIAIRDGNVSVALAVRNGQFEYATRRLVHLVQEVFMIFLPDGPYSDYRVEKLGLDPDIA
jgi:hypothetical protein